MDGCVDGMIIGALLASSNFEFGSAESPPGMAKEREREIPAREETNKGYKARNARHGAARLLPSGFLLVPHSLPYH